jgi:hypothetical protein
LNERDVASIEKKFGVTLPAAYRRLLIDPPDLLEALVKQCAKEWPGQCLFFLTKGEIVELNEIVRDPDEPYFQHYEEGGEDRPWNERYFVIGQDVGGNLFCIAPESGTCRVYHQLNGDFCRYTKFANDAAHFVKRLFKLFGEIAAMDCDVD